MVTFLIALVGQSELNGPYRFIADFSQASEYSTACAPALRPKIARSTCLPRRLDSVSTILYVVEESALALVSYSAGRANPRSVDPVHTSAALLSTQPLGKGLLARVVLDFN